MNIQGAQAQKSRSKSRWLIFILYVLIIFGTEPFYRQPLFNFSLDFIEKVQGDEPKHNNILHVAEFISHLGNTGVFIPIILIVYNFANIYKTYILLMTILLSTMFISILKMLYISPRPFWKNQKIEIFGCEGGWGNPSGHSLASTAFYLTFWHIIFECHALRNNKILKRISLAATILFIFTIMLSRTFVGAHSINQILFGFLIGFGIYFFIFYVLCVKVNDSKQFLSYIAFRNLIYGFINFFIFLFVVLIFNFNQHEELFSEWKNEINKKCPEIPDNKRLQNEALVTFATFLTNLGAFYGIKFEYYFSFGENIQNWRQFNFEIDERSDDESLMTKITINKETQWNHTNSFYSILRLLVIILLCAFFMLPYFFIEWSDNLLIVLIFKVFFPLNMITFSFFYLFKIILKSLRMVNLTLYSMLQDSL
jgi:membrane-associated phospholipid phosphatase